MQSAKRLRRVSLRQSLRRLLTLMLLLPAVMLPCISATTSPAYSQTTTTTPCDPTPTDPVLSTVDPQTWAACRTQHDVENLRADALYGIAILIALAAALFVSSLLVASRK
jgi:hypothetical protein